MLKHCYITVFYNKTFFFMCYFKADCIKMMINVKIVKIVFFFIVAFVELI